MEADTPKRHAIEKFIQKENANLKEWDIRVIDEKSDPIVHIQAVRSSPTVNEPPKVFEVHTRQVTTLHDDVDDLTKTRVRRWLASLTGKGAAEKV